MISSRAYHLTPVVYYWQETDLHGDNTERHPDERSGYRKVEEGLFVLGQSAKGSNGGRNSKQGRRYQGCRYGNFKYVELDKHQVGDLLRKLNADKSDNNQGGQLRQKVQAGPTGQGRCQRNLFVDAG